ncbi:hypothetical protein C8R45DRAFT_1128459 [Mycena sanguinolenta]|nr:hypothetical protein C8R45DRAFT_1128459 [Mycena sanguinolenta]
MSPPALAVPRVSMQTSSSSYRAPHEFQVRAMEWNGNICPFKFASHLRSDVNTERRRCPAVAALPFLVSPVLFAVISPDLNLAALAACLPVPRRVLPPHRALSPSLLMVSIIHHFVPPAVSPSTPSTHTPYLVPVHPPSSIGPYFSPLQDTQHISIRFPPSFATPMQRFVLMQAAYCRCPCTV